MLGPGRYDKKKKKIGVLPSSGHSSVAGMEPDFAKVLLKKVLSVLL